MSGSDDRRAPVSCRLGDDVRDRFEQFESDFELSTNKAAERAIDRGLQSLGYANGDDTTGQTALGKAAGTAALPLAGAGLGMGIGSSLPPSFLAYGGSVLLAVAVVALFVERVEPVFSSALGIPKTKQHPEVATDGGGEES